LRRKEGVISAVADVSFTVSRGETFGLVGESGCGKTTVGRLVVGLETATSGSVSYSTREEEPTGRAGELFRARQRQMMFQDPYSSLDPRQRVRDILAEPLEIHQMGDSSSREARIRELIDAVGLPQDAAARYPHEFSGGQRQRIGLARALALNPQLIVADEPVSALDVSIQAQVLNLMQDLQDELGLSYILVSHDLAVVQHASDRIGVMYLGKLVEVGPADDVFLDPVHPYTRALIDAVPVPVVGATDATRTPLQGEIPSAANPPSGCRFRTRCAFADDACVHVEPEMVEYAPGHAAACHHPLRTPVRIGQK
jgi:oligopeptide/dipeptide ABC transporter ATP-binding protein